MDRNWPDVEEPIITQVLQSKNGQGKVKDTVELLTLYQESSDGRIRPYDPAVTMLGAVNRGDVTCYLDALLFGMYGILESFESILQQDFQDDRKHLVLFLRIW